MSDDLVKVSDMYAMYKLHLLRFVVDLLYNKSVVQSAVYRQQIRNMMLHVQLVVGLVVMQQIVQEIESSGVWACARLVHGPGSFGPSM